MCVSNFKCICDISVNHKFWNQYSLRHKVIWSFCCLVRWFQNHVVGPSPCAVRSRQEIHPDHGVAASKHPVFEETQTNPSHQRGKWETLARLGTVLESMSTVRFIICDGAGSHEWAHRLLLGQCIPVTSDLLECIPFWKRLSYEELPCPKFPLGYRVCRVDKEALTYMPGIAHIAKNSVDQLRSSLRTIRFGRLHADMSQGLCLGMSPAAFIGSDSMSDHQAALWLLGIKVVKSHCYISCLQFFRFYNGSFFFSKNIENIDCCP